MLSCTAEGELFPAEFRCAPHVCPTLDCWSLRSRERPRLQGVCPSCWYGCLDTGSPPTDVSGTVTPNPGTCTIGCRDGFREDAALATNGSCTPHSDQMVPHHSEDCEPLLGFQPCWGGNAGGMACVPSGKPCPTAPNASYAGMATTCVASTCPAPDLGPTLKGAPLATPVQNFAIFFSLFHLKTSPCICCIYGAVVSGCVDGGRMGDAHCEVGCADGYYLSTPPESCVDGEIPETWVTAGFPSCAEMAASFGCDFDGTVTGNAVPLGPEGTVLKDLCPVTCDDCPEPEADMVDDVWFPEDPPCGATQ
eukprot:COSAG02_NODE_1146_length_14225_cov_10.142989_2_plen_307_part_00